jgi:hypothetical protein
MNNEFYDPIVAEVRKNREEMLAEFGGDTKKLTEYLESKRPEMEAAGLRFETEEERQARLAWKKKQKEELSQKIAAL